MPKMARVIRQSSFPHAQQRLPVMLWDAGIVVTAFVTAAAGAIYPARFASRIEPAEALRYE